MNGLHHLIIQYQSNNSQNVLDNYMIWKLISTFQIINASSYDVQMEKCIKKTESIFPSVFTNMYVKSKNIERMEANEIIQLIKSSYKEVIGTSIWLDQDSSNNAKHKLKKMGIKIGYNDYVLNNTWLNSGNLNEFFRLYVCQSFCACMHMYIHHTSYSFSHMKKYH